VEFLAKIAVGMAVLRAVAVCELRGQYKGFAGKRLASSSVHFVGIVVSSVGGETERGGMNTREQLNHY